MRRCYNRHRKDMTPPSTESLFRLLAFVTGVTSTVIGSWISSKIHVYHENRKVHLEEIKQKVLVPIRQNLADNYAALVKHKSFAVIGKWGTRKRLAPSLREYHHHI